MDDNQDYLVPIGQVAIFYLPMAKLEVDPHLININSYFRTNHFGYTVQSGKISGYWMKEAYGEFLAEENTRFEVSFDGGVDVVNRFVDFLSDLCFAMGEDAIYLTMGYKSYLVLPRKKDSNG